MRAALILADAATGHPDGTFSLLRGGITQVNIPPNRPVLFKGALVARVEGTRGEAGKHKFKIVCVTEDGGEVAPPIEGELEIPPQGGAANVVMNMQLAFPKLGNYEFAILIDKQQQAVWPLEAKQAIQGAK